MARRLLIIVQEALFFTTHRLPVGLAMLERGWEVHVAGPADPEIARRIEAAGLHFHPIALARGGQNPVDELRLLLALLGLLNRLRPELVHYVSIKPVLWGGLASRCIRHHGVVHAITGLGSVFRGTGLKAWIRRHVVRLLYAVALGNPRSMTIFQNGDDLEEFRTRNLVDDRRWAMIRGCGVDTNRFARHPEVPVDPEHPPVVMFPARLIADKGLHEFIGAAERLQAAGMPARFVLVGRLDLYNPSGIGQRELNDWVARGVVEYWGFSEDMPGILKQAHIVVMPSFYGEGVPRSLIEAAAVGRAIVTADSPGCREIVRHEENGLLVPARDTEATTRAIERLLADPVLRQRLGAQGRKMVEESFSVERFVADSMAVYKQAMLLSGNQTEP